jgi:hypothetical protein
MSDERGIGSGSSPRRRAASEALGYMDLMDASSERNMMDEAKRLVSHLSRAIVKALPRKEVEAWIERTQRWLDEEERTA